MKETLQKKLPPQLHFPLGLRALLAVASFVIIVAGLKAAAPILIPMLFAFFLAVLGTGPVHWLGTRGIPKAVSVFLVCLVVATILTSIGIMLVTSVDSYTSRLPEYQKSLEALTQDLISQGEEFGLTNISMESLKDIQPNSMMKLVGSTLGQLVSAVSATFLVLILMIFMLIEAADFSTKMRGAFGDSQAIMRFSEIAIDVQRYLAIKTFTSVITGVLIAVFVYFIGLDFPALWGFIAYLLNYIPIIGSIIAAIPAILLGIVTLPPAGVITLAIGYFLINSGISHFVEPVLMGRRLGLSALVILLSLAFWGWIWGPLGALMSIPLTMILKILLEHTDDLHWLSTLMGPKQADRATLD